MKARRSSIEDTSTEAPEKLSSRNQKQRWPFIKKRVYPKNSGNSSGAIGWMVDARTANGGERRTFQGREEAETFATQCRIRRANEGSAAFGNEDLARYGKTVSDAVAFYVAHLRQMEKSVRFVDALQELVELRSKSGQSKRYCHDLELRLGRFVKDHPDVNVASFDSKALDVWLTGLKVAAGTRNTFRRDLHTIFSFCVKRGYVTTNPVINTEKAKVVSGPPGILTVAQSVALLNACEAATLPFVAISLFAGLRAAEMEKLDWSEVDLEGGHIEVTAKKAKTARRRLIPISENLAAWIQPLAARKGSVVPVGLRKRFDAVKARAGLSDWPPNAMRHSFASYRLAQCHDAARVSLEMGNSPQMVFAHYRELVREKDARRYWAITPALGNEKVVAFTAK